MLRSQVKKEKLYLEIVNLCGSYIPFWDVVKDILRAAGYLMTLAQFDESFGTAEVWVGIFMHPRMDCWRSRWLSSLSYIEMLNEWSENDKNRVEYELCYKFSSRAFVPALLHDLQSKIFPSFLFLSSRELNFKLAHIHNLDLLLNSVFVKHLY